jgi:hypothetical protein
MEVAVPRKSVVVLLLIASMSIPLTGVTEDRHAAAAASQAPVLALTPKLRAALVAEMGGIRQGMSVLAPALAMGEWETAAAQAQRIRDSYIMQQKLSPAELQELERVLPADFADRDARFHQHAEGLAHAAHAHDSELAVFYFSKMLEGCGGCHARYATHVLPGHRPEQPAAHRH